MGRAHVQKKNFEQAISLFRSLPGLQEHSSMTPHPEIPQITADLAYAYAMSGRRPEALQELAKLTEMSKRESVPSWAFAVVFTVLGDTEQAFKSLEKSYDERPSDLPNLRVDSRMEPLRSDPRYKRLLQRMGLPE
jgi:Flp pilus assembly protein TadD